MYECGAQVGGDCRLVGVRAKQSRQLSYDLSIVKRRRTGLWASQQQARLYNRGGPLERGCAARKLR